MFAAFKKRLNVFPMFNVAFGEARLLKEKKVMLGLGNVKQILGNLLFILRDRTCNHKMSTSMDTIFFRLHFPLHKSSRLIIIILWRILKRHFNPFFSSLWINGNNFINKMFTFLFRPYNIPVFCRMSHCFKSVKFMMLRHNSRLSHVVLEPLSWCIFIVSSWI